MQQIFVTVDIFEPAQRSAMMGRIRGKNSVPELAVRRVAHALGYRYRLHRRDLPGTPDLVFPKLRKVVFVHGCFWHRHTNCRFAYTPKSNQQFWLTKFRANTKRDAATIRKLRALGWKELVIWECATRDHSDIEQTLSRFLARPFNTVTSG